MKFTFDILNIQVSMVMKINTTNISQTNATNEM